MPAIPPQRKTALSCLKQWGTMCEFKHPGMAHACGEDKGHVGAHKCIFCQEEKA